ncbi:hypothetical protein IJ541_10850 [bacterium]|nr:hypothetical protein [bacterium]
MASIIDAFNESLNENQAYVKIVLFAIPIYFVADLFLVGKMAQFTFWGAILAVLVLGLLTQGIHNVRLNRSEVLTLNPIDWVVALSKAIIVLTPQFLIFGSIGYFLTTKITIPIDLPHVPMIYSVIVWSIVFSIILTSYLSFAKYLKVLQGFNYKVIFESCIDVLVSFLFFLPQLIFANVVLIGPVMYLFFVFNVPYTHWGFVAYCSAIGVINISILANYLAQSGYEQIKGNNEDYQDNCQINVIDDAAERLNGH